MWAVGKIFMSVLLFAVVFCHVRPCDSYVCKDGSLKAETRHDVVCVVLCIYLAFLALTFELEESSDENSRLVPVVPRDTTTSSLDLPAGWNLLLAVNTNFTCNLEDTDG